MIGAVDDRHLDVHNWIAGQLSFAHGLEHAFLNGRNILLGDCAPKHFVLKDPAAPSLIGLHVDPAVSVLTVTARLLLVLPLDMSLALDGLTIRNLGDLEVDVDAELLLKALDNNLEVSFSKTAQNCLVRFAVLVDDHRRLFFFEAAQCGTQLVVVCPCLWLQ